MALNNELTIFNDDIIADDPIQYDLLSEDELNKLVIEASTTLNFSPELLLKLTESKKRELIKESRKLRESKPPEYYVKELNNTCIENILYSKNTFRRISLILNSPKRSAHLIKNLEISLRTNQIAWVKKFLDSPLNGLDAINGYLKNSLNSVQIQNEQKSLDSMPSINRRNSISSVSQTQSKTSKKRLSIVKSSFKLKKSHEDDVHECICCLRAIMNNQYGLRMIIDHKEAINCIVLSLKYPNYRTKSLVLDLLGIICRVNNDAHITVLKAFDNFKIFHNETYRFETLMSYFDQDLNETDFMVTCLHFINILVNSSQNKNFRFYLQYEFTQLGLDEYLSNKLSNNSLLQVQVQSYLDNHFDVQEFLDDADAKIETILELEKIRDNLLIEKDVLNKAQDDSLNKINELQNELYQIKSQLNQDVAEKETLMLDITKTNNLLLKPQVSSIPPPPAPPAPTPLQIVSPPPPPPPLMMTSCDPIIPNKKKIDTKYQLPKLNWIALKPQQIKDTIFSELDEEKYFKVIFNLFSLD